jgi:hypothetical protein
MLNSGVEGKFEVVEFKKTNARRYLSVEKPKEEMKSSKTVKQRRRGLNQSVEKLRSLRAREVC